MWNIIHCDCLEEMKKMADNSIDFIVTDPPYGLHFMGKGWDAAINSLPYWQEMLRICKPGSMFAAFGAPRTHYMLMSMLDDAGWEIRDCIMWLYGSGFPKSHNFGNKLGKEWEGYGTALKPAYEPIIIAMKPLEGTYIQNAEKWGVAGINIDDCRIGAGGTKRSHQAEYPKNEDGTEDRSQHWARTGHEVVSNGLGRWPANIILDEEAAEELDRQTGNLGKSQGGKSGHTSAYSGGFKQEYYGEVKPGFGDSGGASRFFYCAKSSSSERNAGLEGMPLKPSVYSADAKNGEGLRVSDSKFPKANNHPTVKPIALMKYIIKLLAPPGSPICLDPFAGSGSTLVAAKELGIKCIGIEKEAEYCEIARKRIESCNIEPIQTEFEFNGM